MIKSVKIYRLSLPGELHQKLKEVAAELEVTMNSLIIAALERKLNRIGQDDA